MKKIKVATKEVKIAEAKGRPMLHWVGKKSLSRLPVFPAQMVETFIPKGAEKDKPNLLFHGDNKEVLAHLLANGYRGKVDLIYIDPPFDSAADYVRKIQLRGGKDQLSAEGQSIMEQVQYTDLWANDNYLQFMFERFLLIKELLSDRGSLLIHVDWHKCSYLKIMLDEVFGDGLNDSAGFRNELIWCYAGGGTPTTEYPRKHDNILWYSKSQTWIFNVEFRDYSEGTKQRGRTKVKGENAILNVDGTPINDWWTDIEKITSPTDPEKLNYPTQKSEELLNRIISVHSNAEDIVLDCFIGSGTSAAVAQKLGRRWIGCDINKGAIQTTSKRLQKIIEEQMKEATGKTVKPEVEPASRSFIVQRVNDYDLQIQHNEAMQLAVECIGITRTKEDNFFEGILGTELAKIVPLQHPCTLLDIQLIADELKKRSKEERNIVIVCLGKESAVDAKVEGWNKLHPINKLRIIELRTDNKYGKFFEHKPCKAKVKVERKGKKLSVKIEDFLSPSIIERLQTDGGLLQPKIEDWRSMVDCVLIDTAYDGKVFNIQHSNVPEKKQDLVDGSYTLELPTDKKRTVAVKIIDMLGEELLIAKEV